MPQHKLEHIILIILLIIAAFGSFFVYFQVSAQKQTIIQQQETINNLTRQIATFSLKNLSQTSTSQIPPPPSFPSQNLNNETSPILDTSNWKTYRNEKYGFEVKYPELNFKYVDFRNWPPSIYLDSVKNWNCPQKQDPLGYGGQKEIVINGNKYCISSQGNGTGGLTYIDYNYTTIKERRYISLDFVIRYANCEVFGEPDLKKCINEQKNLNIDQLIDQIVSSLKFIK